MSGALSPTEWTWDEYARLPDDGNRYEVLDGEVLVTPAPGTSHQRIAARLWRCLDEYVSEHGIGEVLWDVDLLFVTGQFLRPDMVYVARAAREGVIERGVESVPGLVVEVLSPSSRRIDTVRKPARYAEFGVPAYWVVDPGRSAILVWDFDAGTTEPRLETDLVLWLPEAGVPPLQLAVPSLFGR